MIKKIGFFLTLFFGFTACTARISTLPTLQPYLFITEAHSFPSAFGVITLVAISTLLLAGIMVVFSFLIWRPKF